MFLCRRYSKKRKAQCQVCNRRKFGTNSHAVVRFRFQIYILATGTNFQRFLLFLDVKMIPCLMFTLKVQTWLHHHFSGFCENVTSDYGAFWWLFFAHFLGKK